jgi:8-oxo-dGTP diphosphatase
VIEPGVRLHLGAYGLCLDREGRLLLARIRGGPDDGRWTLPGGQVEPREHPDDAVQRELLEETGLRATAIGSVLGVYSHVDENAADRREQEPVQHIGLVYEILAVTGTLTGELDGTTDRCEFFDTGAALGLPLVPLAAYGVSLAWA